mgnify:CR=1 FL=1
MIYVYKRNGNRREFYTIQKCKFGSKTLHEVAVFYTDADMDLFRSAIGRQSEASIWNEETKQWDLGNMDIVLQGVNPLD